MSLISSVPRFGFGIALWNERIFPLLFLDVLQLIPYFLLPVI